MERYSREDYERYREAQNEKAARAEQERLARTEKETARRAWLADGGNAGDFERKWPMLRDEGRRRRVIDADRCAREMMQASGVSCI